MNESREFMTAEKHALYNQKSMSLVPYDDPILYYPTIAFDFAGGEDLSSLIYMMKEVLDKNKGLGLSANQLGIPYSIFIMTGDRGVIPIINPKIVDRAAETNVMEEGCLSFPGLIVKMKRSLSIRVRFADLTGNIQTMKFSGITARVFQHEMCHLLGRPFFDGTSKLKLEMAVRKCQKTYGISYPRIFSLPHGGASLR